MADKPVIVDIKRGLAQNLTLLQAGSMVSIDISTPAGQKGKFRTTFVGFLPNQYMLIQFPEAKKLGNFSQYISQGTNITVRGLIEGKEGTVVAFASKVKQIIQMPSKLLVLYFPHSVTLQHLRSSMRIGTEIVSKVKVEEVFWPTTMLDLSISGCQLYIDNADKLVLSEDKPVLILVEKFKGLEGIKLVGNVCGVKHQNSGLSFGIEFDKKSQEHVKRLLHHAVSV